MKSGFIWLDGDGPIKAKQFRGNLQREWIAFWMGLGSFVPKIKISVKFNPRRVCVTEFEK